MHITCLAYEIEYITLPTGVYLQKSFKSSTMQVGPRRYTNISKKIIYPEVCLVNISNCPDPIYATQDINYQPAQA